VPSPNNCSLGASAGEAEPRSARKDRAHAILPGPYYARVRRLTSGTVLLLGLLVIGGLAPGTSGAEGSGSTPRTVASSTWGAWRQQGNPVGFEPGPLLGLSCPTSTSCVAVSGSVVATADGGAEWTGGWRPRGFAGLQYVSCPTANFCMAVGTEQTTSLLQQGASAAARSTDGGRTWSGPIPVPDLSQAHGLTCVDTLHCWLWGAYIQAPNSNPVVDTTTDGGNTWTSQTSAFDAYGFDHIDGFSCVSDDFCAATATQKPVTYPQVWDPYLVWTTDGGQTWSDDDLATSGTSTNVGAISCPTSSTCYAVSGGNGVIRGTYNASGSSPWTWQQQDLQPGAPQLSTIECPATDECLAGGMGAILESAPGSAAWTTSPAPAGDYDFYAISCPNPSTCWASGGNSVITDEGIPVIAMTEDGGAQWVPQYLSGVEGGAADISCSSSTQCMALFQGDERDQPSGLLYEDEALSTADAGSTWVPHVLQTRFPVGSLSCVANVCRLLEPGAHTVLSTVDWGTTWSAEDLPDGYDQAMACPSVTECLAVRPSPAGVAVTHDGGKQWTTVPLPVSMVFGVDCPTTETCMVWGNPVQGGSGFAITNNGGTTWAARGDLKGASAELASCPTALVCFVFWEGRTSAEVPEDAVLETTDGGAHWQVPWSATYPGPNGYTPYPTAMSCPDLSDCLVVVAGGPEAAEVRISTDGARSWQAWQLSPVSADASASCVTVAACWVIDSMSVIWTNYRSPVPPTGYRLARASGSVSCFGAPRCVPSTAPPPDRSPVVAVADDSITGGCWLVSRDGSVDALRAVNVGSANGETGGSPVVGAVATVDGGGLFVATAAGGVVALGDARWHGSEAGRRLHAPIVGIALDPQSGGYWLVASDGGVFGFDAPYRGGEGGTHLNKPIVGVAAAPTGIGYWLVASDGGIFGFHASFFGSEGGARLNSPIVAMAPDAATGGYWLVASDGGVFTFHARYFGSLAGTRAPAPVVAVTPS
jgi:hypothetical protein